MPPPPLPEKISPPLHAEPEPEDFDIFADAGDYEGIDLGDDEQEEQEGPMKDVQVPQPSEGPSTILRGRWFATDEDQPPQPDTSPIVESTSKSHSPPSPHMLDDDEEPEQPTRLVPLESSAIPSIQDLLAMDGAQDKRKKRKDKKKGGKGVDPEEKKKVTAEAKADRDYKRSVFVSFIQRVRCDCLVCTD
jgi:hypothetical protein